MDDVIPAEVADQIAVEHDSDGEVEEEQAADRFDLNVPPAEDDELLDGEVDDEEDEEESDYDEEEEEEEDYYESDEPDGVSSPVRVSCGIGVSTETEPPCGGIGDGDDGLFCPICMDAWASGGQHRLCCLPCGHMYGLSCIKRWLQLPQSSGKCPQCNRICSFNDVILLYASRICVVDDKLKKKVQSLEAKCASLEKKVEDEIKDRDIFTSTAPSGQPSSSAAPFDMSSMKAYIDSQISILRSSFNTELSRMRSLVSNLRRDFTASQGLANQHHNEPLTTILHPNTLIFPTTPLPTNPLPPDFM